MPGAESARNRASPLAATLTTSGDGWSRVRAARKVFCRVFPRDRLSFRHRAIGVVLFGFALSSAGAETIRVLLVSREAVESRLREYSGTNSERGARLARMFADAGCSEHVSEQAVKYSKAPNVLCVLPGTSGRIIIVGAHFDRVRESAGVADNWSGASLLPSLYEAVKTEPRQHTYVFIGFTDEEEGLVGSRFYARKMTPEQVAATDAMVNLDTLGLAPTEVWAPVSYTHLTLPTILLV